MQKALATIRQGRVEFDRGVDWPEGTRVEVLPIESVIGMNEADWPTTAEGIAALVKRMNEREPLEITEAEYTQWETERQAEKERQKELTRQSWAESEVVP